MWLIYKVFNQYGLINSIKIIKNIVLTRFLFRSARLVKFPIDIRNKRSIQFGPGFSTGIFCRIEAYPLDYSKVVLSIGSNFKINDYVHIAAHEKVEIGNNVLIASNVFITDLSHGSYTGNEFDDNPMSLVDTRELTAKPVSIGNNVWIGQGAIILPGVKVGCNSVIGAGSVVTKSIPDNCIAVGNPANVVKQYDFKLERWCRV